VQLGREGDRALVSCESQEDHGSSTVDLLTRNRGDAAVAGQHRTVIERRGGRGSNPPSPALSDCGASQWCVRSVPSASIWMLCWCMLECLVVRGVK